ncbi:probable E3 ubiquitin- ligase makorin-1 [Pelobates cultripes]|uniref:RING-type E3 ubiquitin transferase n=1 Tax=Pelobates cultripes TaxID=61616 RepID=A0AAD1R0E8_PELCU|nr:probable E3 ubiquitin- ligase makorin-1 [Pelobates cultripes]
MATASGRGASIRVPCRAFSRGACRWGQNCKFSHERKPTQICRHFQNGFCGYGEKCSFLHLTADGSSDAPAHNAGRRVSEPCLLPYSHDSLPGRRGSEPAVPHRLTAGASSGRHLRSLGRPDWALAPEFVPRNAASGLVRSVSSPTLQEEHSDDKCKEEARARTVETLQSETDASELQYERSRNVVCGICMDKVYDKQVAERIFGILPNCNHAYCVDCIKRWRKTRDFNNEVIKGCPQCRVKSSYFIPHKYWVGESDEKLKLIENFKAKTSKIRCRFFVRGNGHCPFKSECIYRHELPSGHQRRRRREHRRLSATALSYSHMVEIFEEDCSDEEDIDLLHCALTLALIEDNFELDLGFPDVEILWGEYSDSD